MECEHLGTISIVLYIIILAIIAYITYDLYGLYPSSAVSFYITLGAMALVLFQLIMAIYNKLY